MKPLRGGKNRKREIKLSEWAEWEGINLRTAQRMHSRGELPVPVRVTATGRIMVLVPEDEGPTPHTPEELKAMLFAIQQQLASIERKLDSSS
jgi:hypothetical protein